jgi:hypothetical protein
MTDIWSFEVALPEPRFDINLTTGTEFWELMQGKDGGFYITVENNGNYADNIQLMVNLGTIPDTITIKLSENELTIAPNKSSDILVEVSVSSETPCGQYIIKFTATSLGAQKYGQEVKDSIDIYLVITTKPPEDKDNDNLPDNWEIDWFDDIDKYDGNDDPDGDGRTNLQEYNDGTDPTTPDAGPDGKKPGKKLEDDTGMMIVLIIAPIIVSVLILLIILHLFLKKKKGGGSPEKQLQEPKSITPPTSTPVQQPPQPPKKNEFLDYKVQDQDGFRKY